MNNERRDRYVYAGVINDEEDGLIIEFPDFPGCVAFSISKEMGELIKNAEDVLGLYLLSLEDKEGSSIPDPSTYEKLYKEGYKKILYVSVYMPLIREQINKRLVKKTLTIPEWLNDEAEKKGINFSDTLREALKSKLGLSSEFNKIVSTSSPLEYVHIPVSSMRPIDIEDEFVTPLRSFATVGKPIVVRGSFSEAHGLHKQNSVVKIDNTEKIVELLLDDNSQNISYIVHKLKDEPAINVNERGKKITLTGSNGIKIQFDKELLSNE